MEGPFDKEWRPFADAVIKTCIEHAGPGVGVMVLMFEFGIGGRMNYMSNAQRKDMIVALKELIATFEGRAQEGTGTLQ